MDAPLARRRDRGRSGPARRRGDRARARGSVARGRQRRRAARRAARARLRHRATKRGAATQAGPHRSTRSRASGARRACAAMRMRRDRALWVAAERLPQFDALSSATRSASPAIDAPAEFASARGRATTRCVEIVRSRLEGLGSGDGGSARAIAGAAAGRHRDARSPRWPPKASRCSGIFTPGRDASRMVRPRAARAHPSLHRQAAARRRSSRSSTPGLHALPVSLAARRARRAARRAPTRSTRSSRSCRASRRPRRRGKPRSCRRGSTTTTSPGSTTCACPAARCGRASRSPGERARREPRPDSHHAGRAAAAAQRAAVDSRWRRRRRSAAGALSSRAQRRRRTSARRTAHRSSTRSSTAPACCARRSRKRSPSWWRSGLVTLRQLRRLARAAHAVGEAQAVRRRRAPSSQRAVRHRGRRALGAAQAGRSRRAAAPRPASSTIAETVEHIAHTLLRRYGVVFWRLLAARGRVAAAVARAAARAAPARSARRHSRRPLRRRRHGRAVRAARGGAGMLRETRRAPPTGELVVGERRRSAESGRRPAARREGARAHRQSRPLSRRRSRRRADRRRDAVDRDSSTPRQARVAEDALIKRHVGSPLLAYLRLKSLSPTAA